MSKSKFLTAAFVALCCLFACSETQAQSAYGYASIVYDEGTDMVSGYGSTDLDYTTAYYYDAQADAQITDGNGNVLASGSATGNPAAIVSLDVIDVLLCIPYDIIITIILRPVYYYDYDFDFGCRGYNDYFGFDDFWWGSFWDYGGFTSGRGRSCSYRNVFYVARIIARVIECLPANVTVRCSAASEEVLPGEFRPIFELPFVSGMDNTTLTCTARDESGNGVSNQTVNFRLGSDVIDSGGHEFHTGQRPKGILSPTTVKTGPNGEAQSRFTAPIFGGSTRVVMSIPGGNQSLFNDIRIKVPGLQELPPGDNYRRFGGNTKHPFNHYANPYALTGLQVIADDYKNEYYPNGWVAPPAGTQIDSFNSPIDHYKIHYNDISVRNGGKFEAREVNDWKPNVSHGEHRVGINCDTRSSNIDRSRWARLNEFFFNRGSTDTNDETNNRNGGPHWHLRFVFGGQKVPKRSTRAFGDAPAPIPGRVEAEQYDNGDNTEAYYVPFTGLPNPDEKPDDVTVYDAADGSSYVGSTAGGQWMNYTVNVSSSGSYTFDTRVASSVGGGTFHFEVDGVDKTGSLGIPNTGSSAAFQSVVIDDIVLDAGQHNVRLVVEGSELNVASFDSFTVSPYTVPEACNPSSWEIRDCQYYGGYWDNYFCQCNYGMY